MGVLTSSQDLYTALGYLEGTIGVPVKYSAEHTGIELLRTLNDTPEGFWQWVMYCMWYQRRQGLHVDHAKGAHSRNAVC